MRQSSPIRSVLAGLTLCLAAGSAGAQQCVTYLPPALLDTSHYCLGNPLYRRAVAVDTLDWGGSDYLVLDIGNNLELYRIDDPQAPVRADWSAFQVTPHTDDDENLKYMSICDDCRFGVAGFGIEGVVLFDLGIGTTPNIGSSRQYTATPRNAYVNGGFTYSHGGIQYLMASGVTSTCNSIIANSGLYRFSSIDLGTADLIRCVTTASGAKISAEGGFYLPTNAGTFLYVIGSGQAHIFEVGSVGSDLTYRGAFPAPVAGPRAFAVDAAAELAISAPKFPGIGTPPVSIWDISAPAAPTLLWSGAPAGDHVAYETVDLRYPLAFAGKGGAVSSGAVAHLLDISTPTAPVAVDEAAWDATAPHNALSSCVWNHDAAFSPDGGTMYLARYSVAQKFAVDSCWPAIPIAGISLVPGTGFPGDALTIASASTGTITEWAIWAEDDHDVLDPPGGNQLSSTTPVERSFTIPVDVAESTSFTANVAVANRDYPYDPDAPGQQLATRAVTIDRAPGAAIALSPELPTMGETLTLTGSADGHPQAPGGSSPFSWDISPPAGAACPAAYPSCTAAGSVIDVPLTASGDWAFELTVHYLHVVAGVPYTAPAQRSLSVFSVAADFTVTPATPLTDQPITLTSTSSIAAGVTPTYSWSITGASSYTGCPTEPVCTIPPDTLAAGAYDIALTVTNPTNGDQDTAGASVDVVNGDPPLELSWFPNSPNIGELVGFQISGVTDIQQANWNFGGAGCNWEYPSSATCTIGLGEICMAKVHQYSTAGTKTVSLSVVVNGETIGPVTRTVTVQNAGGCGTTSCAIGIDPTTADVAPAGASDSLGVSTDALCAWTATSDDEWITVTSGASGTGAGTIGYSVAANYGGARSGKITIVDATFTVTQGSSPDMVFADGFEDGLCTHWSASVGLQE